MNRIPPVTSENAPAATRPLLEAVRQKLGMVPNLFATIGSSPEALEMLLSATDALNKGALSGKEIEAINLHASEINGCAYCVAAHTALGKRAGLSVDEIAGAREGRGSGARERAMLALARRVLRTGGSSAGSELAAAREAGLNDRELIEVLAHVALKSFTNAVAIVAQTQVDFPKPPQLPQL